MLSTEYSVGKFRKYYVEQATKVVDIATKDSWEDRVWASRALSVLLFLVPLGVALVVVRATASFYYRSPAVGGQFLWLLQILIVAIVTSYLTSRLLTRFRSLPALLRLSLQWPGTAPSRLAVALGAQSSNALARTFVALPEEESAAAFTALAMISDRRNQDRKAPVRSFRIAGYADLVASELEFDDASRNQLRWAVLLHDIGLITVPPEVLQKKGAFTTSEAMLYQRHPNISARILGPLATFLGSSYDAAGQHHEHWDGKGYPHGLGRTKIGLSARICAVADAYDAMTWPRRGRSLLTDEEACAELLRKSGTQFDPQVANAMVAVAPLRRRAVAGWLPVRSLPPFITWRASNALGPAFVTLLSALTLPLLTASMSMPAEPLPTLAFDDAEFNARFAGEGSINSLGDSSVSVTPTTWPLPIPFDPPQSSAATTVSPSTSSSTTPTTPTTSTTQAPSTTTTLGPTTTSRGVTLTTTAPTTTRAPAPTTTRAPAPTTTRAPAPTTTRAPTTTAAPRRGANVAVNGTASQSSTDFGGRASRAIDGNTSGVWRRDSVTHTSPNDELPSWDVALASNTNIHSIRLWNRTDCCSGRLANFSVFVSDAPFDDDATIEELLADPDVWSYSFDGAAGVTTDIAVNVSGRYVRVQKPSGTALSLAEVQIFEVQ